VLNIPVVGVSALDALALAAGSTNGAIATWVDAHRGEVFAARYSLPPSAIDPVDPDGDVIVAEPDVVLEQWATTALPAVFIGDGALRYRDVIARHTHENATVLVAPPALAPQLAVLGQARARRGEAGAPHALHPMYVRRPDAELERLRRL
jgi:tRNA A37 threonylcarbamoyladenosine modification protein TsaB